MKSLLIQIMLALISSKVFIALYRYLCMRCMNAFKINMNYKNQAISEDLSLAKIKLILISIIIIVIAKREIKNFKEEGVIYTIPIISKYKILLKSRELRGVCLIVLFLA